MVVLVGNLFMTALQGTSITRQLRKHPSKLAQKTTSDVLHQSMYSNKNDYHKNQAIANPLYLQAYKKEIPPYQHLPCNSLLPIKQNQNNLVRQISTNASKRKPQNSLFSEGHTQATKPHDTTYEIIKTIGTLRTWIYRIK